ncbi:MAG: protein SCO1/2 [Verrucomicrobiales bacterium]|jgi:protein SCO1/2
MKTILASLIVLAAISSLPAQENLTLPSAAATEGSIYDLESKWKSQDAKVIALGDLKGKVRVVAMGYTSCKFACPRIIADLQRIEKELVEKGLDSSLVSISFISIDPETDTPERMKKLEKDYRFDPKRWLLLTGDEDGVLELAVALGMKYRQTTAIDFAHSNIITVLAPDGQIAHQTSEIGADLSEILSAIRTASGSSLKK